MNLRVTRSDAQKSWSNGQPANQQNSRQHKDQGQDFDDQDQFSATTGENSLITYNAQGNLVVVQAR